jgi:hypothetical protein
MDAKAQGGIIDLPKSLEEPQYLDGTALMPRSG